MIENTKLLGTIVQTDLKWDLNTANIVKKANMRMELLRKSASFGASHQDLKDIYIIFIRSLLEQSATVWHSSLTDQNKSDLERVQKCAVKVILKEEYRGYKSALARLDLLSLDERREQLCLSFALKCTKHNKHKNMFPLNQKSHNMQTRFTEKYKVQHAHTERLKSSSIIYMQHLLNEHEVQNIGHIET